MIETADPGVIVSELKDISTAFDRIGEQFGCERIKTIGDVYVTATGVPDPQDDHATAVANAAIRFVRYIERPSESHPNTWRCRVGSASGAVIGSVVGVQKYLYDVFGPALTRAQRLRLLAEPMTICADGSIASRLGERVQADADQFAQVVLNLLCNADQAIAASGAGGRIAVSSHRKGLLPDPPGDRLHLHEEPPRAEAGLRLDRWRSVGKRPLLSRMTISRSMALLPGRGQVTAMPAAGERLFRREKRLRPLDQRDERAEAAGEIGHRVAARPAG
jgi:hypothetical protein